ncbi:hypothetical protein D3C87_339330 [compost metagenome]
MKTQISVLWIEDDAGWLETTKDTIESSLRAWGFELVSQNLRKVAEIEKEIGEDLKHKYDFVFVDFNLDKLDGSTDGAKLIGTFRQKNKFTEVLFYSSTSDFRKKLADEFDGVYTADRKFFDDRAMRLIEFYIEKIATVANVRNYIISEVNAIDKILVEILTKVFVTKDGHKKEFFEKAIENIKERAKKAPTKIAKHIEVVEHADLFKVLISPEFSSNDYREGVIRIINADKFSEDSKKKLEDYLEVLKRRNLYAHCDVKDEEKKHILHKHDGAAPEEVTLQQSVEFAKKIQDYKRHFEGILSALSKS